ncbi:hypothetical protein GJ496_001449 [Pomphorhynchus laevis]|nr:hypothetical protein GJ496_001449 [Pomphorhynchus laevis]
MNSDSVCTHTFPELLMQLAICYDKDREVLLNRINVLKQQNSILISMLTSLKPDLSFNLNKLNDESRCTSPSSIVSSSSKCSSVNEPSYN